MSAPSPQAYDTASGPPEDITLSPGVYFFRPHGTSVDPDVAVVAPNGMVLFCDSRWSILHSTNRYEFRRLVPEVEPEKAKLKPKVDRQETPPTSGDWIKTVADVCPGLVSPMPIPELLAELQLGDYSAEGMMQHLLVHFARAHMDRDDELERLRGKLDKIRDILDAE